MDILSKPSKHIAKGRHYLKMSAIPSSCSLHEKLQTHCGSSRNKESFVLLSERNSNDIGAFGELLLILKCGDISEAELILEKERVLRACQPARVLFPGFIRNILVNHIGSIILLERIRLSWYLTRVSANHASSNWARQKFKVLLTPKIVFRLNEISYILQYFCEKFFDSVKTSIIGAL